MKEYYYFGYSDRKLKAFREEKSAVFSNVTRKPIAFIEDGAWFDWNTHAYIAFEEDEVVFDAKTNKPIYFIEKE